MTQDQAERRNSWWSRRSGGTQVLIALLVLFVLLTIALSFFRQGEDADTIPFSDVLEQARSGNVERIEASDRRLKVSLVGGDADVNTRIGRDVDLVQTLSDQGVKVGGIGGVELRYKSPSPIGNWIGLVFNFIPLIAFAIIYYTVRNAVREGMRQGRREE